MHAHAQVQNDGQALAPMGTFGQDLMQQAAGVGLAHRLPIRV
jgi:hypothetical protein